MAVQKIGWEDETVKGGFGGPNEERKFRGEKGTKKIVRFTTSCFRYRVHSINDVRPPHPKTGEEQGFGMNCSKEWSDKNEEWEGDCEPCERDYDLKDRFICGLILVGIQKGRGKVQKIDPENSPMFWDFAGTMYEVVRDKQAELKQAKKPQKITQVEYIVTCDDDQWQKIRLDKSDREVYTTREHVRAWKEQGDQLIADATEGLDVKTQKRKLKKKKASAGKDGGGRRRSSKEEDPPESLDSSGEDEPLEEASTGDEGMDDLLDELDL